MRILVAEDDPIARLLLVKTLQQWDYQIEEATDGLQALEILQGDAPPPLVILDWMMPHANGIEICRQIRQNLKLTDTYILILTTKNEEEDIVKGLNAGANDYVIKPFRSRELQARLQVGRRVIGLQRQLSERVRQLEDSIQREKQLQGLLPICTYCKKIRDDKDYWQQVETYLERNSTLLFSHSVCPSCFDEIIQPEVDNVDRDSNNSHD